MTKHIGKNKMKRATVEAISFKDVRGKELWYLKITGPQYKDKDGKDQQDELLINVGEKTYKAVTEMNADKTVTKIQFEQPLGDGKAK